MISGGSDDVTPLLLAAGKGPLAAYKQALQAELERIDQEADEERAVRRGQIDAARTAMANGVEVDPSLRMLVKTRDETN
jgi:hypothetical protein